MFRPDDTLEEKAWQIAGFVIIVAFASAVAIHLFRMAL
jgi:hypothetical protein